MRKKLKVSIEIMIKMCELFDTTPDILLGYKARKDVLSRALEKSKEIVEILSMVLKAEEKDE